MFSSIKNMRHITFFQRNLCFAYLAIIYCGILFQSAFAAVVITTGGNQQIPVGSPSTEVSFQVTDDFGNPNTNATITFKISSQLPDLGAGMAVKSSWETVETDSSFNGGIKVNDGEFLQQTVLTSADSVSFQGVINVDSDHIGMPADILVVGGYTPIDLPEQFVMVDDKNNTPNWDLDLTTLGPFARINSLPDQQPVNMYGGKLPIGKVRGWLGYRLDDGLIVFNGSQSINAQINEFVPPVEPPKKETDKTIDDNSSTGKENNEDDIVLPVEPTSLTISGSPVPFAYYTDFDASGFEYHFTPSITKVNNNDIVSFAIDNKPEWATFDDKTQ